MDIIDTLLNDYEVIDLSHTLEEGLPTFPTHSRFYHELWESYWHGDVAVQYQMLINEHTGTHVDAPAHFMRDGHPAHIWMDEMPAASLIGRAVLVDVSDTAPCTTYGLNALERFERANGPVGSGDIVLFRTGWDRKWGIRPDDSAYLRDWPGPSTELADALVARGARAVGCDAMVMDVYGDMEYPIHYILLGHRIMLMENLANLDRLPPVSMFMAIPLRIKGGSGSPIRPLAFVPKAAA